MRNNIVRYIILGNEFKVVFIIDKDSHKVNDVFEENWEPGPIGGTSDCYFNKFDNKIFLKLFHEKIPFNVIKNEYNITKVIKGTNKINVPDAIGFFEHKGRKGIIFERISGKTCANKIKDKKNLSKKYIKDFALESHKLHDSIKDLSIFPNIYKEINDSIDSVFLLRFSRQRFRKNLNNVFNKYSTNMLLHGDLHPGNLMENKNNYYWIDMGFACQGPFIYDLCSSDIMLNFPLTYFFTENQYGLSLIESRRLFTYFLSYYFKTNNKKVLKKWKRKIRLCSSLYMCNVIDKENWQGIERSALKLIILIIAIIHKRNV